METLDGEETPDLVLLSIRSSECAACGAPAEFQQIRMLFPDIPMMILSETEDVRQASWAIQNDVKGYFPATLSVEILVASIRLIFAGGTFVPADMVVSGLSNIREEAGADVVPLLEMNGTELPVEALSVDDLDPGTFTDREAEVVSLLRCGETNKVIARKLDISPSTVKVHVHNIMSKLNARNRTQVVHLLDNLLRQQAQRGHAHI
ncbi:MAG: response regulator transcription factor [Pseudomonadota bacterium]